MAFELEGFCIVRGPDLLWGGDVKNFHPPAGRFDGIIGGPPCQAFSRLRHLVKHNGYAPAENLIPEFERCASESQPTWFLMENVPDAPEPKIAGYQVASHVINNRWVGGVQNRTRRFSFGCRIGKPEGMWNSIQLEALETLDWAPTVCASDGGRSVPVKIGGSGKRKKMGASMLVDRSSRTFPKACELQGLPADFLSESPFTAKGKREVLGNGVPLPLGRAIGKAVWMFSTRTSHPKPGSRPEFNP